MAESHEFKKDIDKAYEDGKHRRYGMLFAINGGALTICKLIVSGSSAEKVVLGGLKLWMLALVMAGFSIVMTADIFAYGFRMRSFDRSLFKYPGRIVLILIGSMLTAAWVLVALPLMLPSLAGWWGLEQPNP
jgi:hypothetical protein